MSATRIEWADCSWNPVTGCTAVSAGCANCYAKRMAKRLAGRFGYPSGDGFAVSVHPERLKEPARWRKMRRVFVGSMGDLFHDDVPFDFLCAVWAEMGRLSRHKFLVLTKRPIRAWDLLEGSGLRKRLLARLAGKDWPMHWARLRCHPNIGIGTSVEDQSSADERLGYLDRTPAAMRFVSVEPMLGPIRLPEDAGWWLHWVICGAETGPGARPMDQEWAIRLRLQCAEMGIPFFFKRAGKGERVSKFLRVGCWPDGPVAREAPVGW